MGLVELAGHSYKGHPDDGRRWEKNLRHNCTNFEKRAVISLAGAEAQARFRARSLKKYHATADYTHVLDMLDRFLWQRDSSKEGSAYIRLLETRTRDLVNAWWPQIKALAAALADRKRLMADEVGAIITSASTSQSN